MTTQKRIPHKELTVRGVYRYFKALEKAKTLKAFLEDCDNKEHTLGVSKSLFNLGHKHFKKSVSLPASVPGGGGECPACPKPPKL
jgi:hypothetical protein